MINAGMMAAAKQLLIKHEGYERYPYTDTLGKTTIGVGYNLTDRGISEAWINNQLETDINYFYNFLYTTFGWFKSLNDPRQIALVDMCFMGAKNLLTFKKMIAALEAKNYYLAAKEMLNSKWANQVGKRAQDLAEMIKTGVY